MGLGIVPHLGFRTSQTPDNSPSSLEDDLLKAAGIPERGRILTDSLVKFAEDNRDGRIQQIDPRNFEKLINDAVGPDYKDAEDIQSIKFFGFVNAALKIVSNAAAENNTTEGRIAYLKARIPSILKATVNDPQAQKSFLVGLIDKLYEINDYKKTPTANIIHGLGLETDIQTEALGILKPIKEGSIPIIFKDKKGGPSLRTP